jgi:hypothetical protein
MDVHVVDLARVRLVLREDVVHVPRDDRLEGDAERDQQQNHHAEHDEEALLCLPSHGFTPDHKCREESMGNTFPAIKELLGQTWKEWQKDDATRIGAALAYYTTFSLAPLLVVATSVAGLVYGKDAAEGEVTKQLTNMLGEQGPSRSRRCSPTPTATAAA